MRSTIIALSFAGLSVAQSTISLFIPGADTQPLIASVISSDKAATTYAVECVPGTDSSDCGFPGGFILTEGPSTAAYTLSIGYQNGSTNVVAFTGYIACTLTGSPASAGECTESWGGDEANFPGISSSAIEAADITYFPVTLSDFTLDGTAVGAAVASATETSNSASPASTTTGAPTASNTSGSKTASSSGTGSSAAQTAGTSSSTAAAAMVTGKAQWVVGGAAIALAML